jgi:hypothetical protein
VGCEARKIPAEEYVFFLDFYLYRTYQVTPFLEPMRGCAAIFNYWSHVAETQREIQFGYEILAVTQEAGIARWWASFLIVPQRLETKLDGIFLIVLDADGRCKSLREWWHKEQK